MSVDNREKHLSFYFLLLSKTEKPPSRFYVNISFPRNSQERSGFYKYSCSFPPLLIFFCLPLTSTYFKAHFSCPEELSTSFNQGVKGIFHCKCFCLATVPINSVSEALILNDFQSSIHSTLWGSDNFGTSANLESNIELITMFMRHLLPPFSFSMCVSSPLWCGRSEKRR